MGEVRVVVLIGEHDVSNVADLRAALERDSPDQPIVIDLTDCRFIDSSSLAVLFEACQASAVGRFAVVAPPDSDVARVLDLRVFGQLVPLLDSRDEAIRTVSG